jgi:hypothetical protein
MLELIGSHHKINKASVNDLDYRDSTTKCTSLEILLWNVITSPLTNNKPAT